MDPQSQNKKQKIVASMVGSTQACFSTALELVLPFLDVDDLFPSFCVLNKSFEKHCSRLLLNHCRSSEPGLMKLLGSNPFPYRRYLHLLQPTHKARIPMIPLLELTDYEILLEIKTCELPPRLVFYGTSQRFHCHDYTPIDRSIYCVLPPSQTNDIRNKNGEVCLDVRVLMRCISSGKIAIVSMETKVEPEDEDSDVLDYWSDSDLLPHGSLEYLTVGFDAWIDVKDDGRVKFKDYLGVCFRLGANGEEMALRVLKKAMDSWTWV